MSETTTGLRAVLSRPQAYLALQWTLGLGKLLRHLIADHIQPSPDLRLLDIGCGPGSLQFLSPTLQYQGFDLNAAYIDYAKKKFGGRPGCEFYCQRVTGEPIEDSQKFDVVLAVGLLHHLDDDEAMHLCRLAEARMKPGGRFITADCTLIDGQSKFAEFLIRRDRGQNVRSPDGYQDIARRVFSDVQAEVRHDLMHIPYSHTIMRMTAHAGWQEDR